MSECRFGSCPNVEETETWRARATELEAVADSNERMLNEIINAKAHVVIQLENAEAEVERLKGENEKLRQGYKDIGKRFSGDIALLLDFLEVMAGSSEE